MFALTNSSDAHEPSETERVGLAHLASLRDHDARLDAIVQIARSLAAEDEERERRRWAGGNPVRIDGDPTAFDVLPAEARRRLMVRVLCELVAYGEDLEGATPARVRLAANAP